MKYKKLINMESYASNSWVSSDALERYLNQLLEVDKFQDYCPNGMQVQGRTRIRKLAVAVTASLSVIESAHTWGADALLVHHGFFWKNEALSITGLKYQRLSCLIKHQINLFVYHIPLDAHAFYGNNKQFANVLGFHNARPDLGDLNRLGWIGTLPGGLSLIDLEQRITQRLRRSPLILGEKNGFIEKIAWCTGAAQGLFEDAINCGVDAYLTGEVSEANFYLANEAGVPFLSCGHHATERYGVQALAKHLCEKFGLEVQFIDAANPI